MNMVEASPKEGRNIGLPQFRKHGAQKRGNDKMLYR
jgi:hypothetical protein